MSDVQQRVQCPICLDDSELDWDTARCGHRFHKTCLNTWSEIYGHPFCPMCRAPLQPVPWTQAPFDNQLVKVVSVFIVYVLIIWMVFAVYGIFHLF